MCFGSKVPSPPPPPAAPKVSTADELSEELRRRLAARKGYASTIKTSALGVRDFGKNASAPSLSAGSRTTLGV
jgi:hypothetical protein